MAAYKVINLNSPIESDYWVDIPVRDPATNKDAVDEEGRILVQRHVTRTVKQNEYQGIVNKIPTYDNLVTSYNTYVTENNRQVHLISEMATTATNNVTKLTETVNNHDSQIHALYTKINAIQGIDIDDFKLVTETNIKNIKNSYLPLVGGTLTGSLYASSTNSEIQVGAHHSSVGKIYLYATSTDKGLHAINSDGRTGYSIISLVGANAIFNGSLNGNATSSTKTTNDSVDRNIVNTYALKSHYPDRISINWDTTFKGYVNLMVDQTTWGLITTGNIAQQSVNYATLSSKAANADVAQRAVSADYASNCTNAVNSTNANHAINADHANSADHAYNANIATRLNGYDHNNSIYLGWDGNNLTMNVDDDDTTKGVVITHKNISSQSVNHATNADHAVNADSATAAVNDSNNRNITNTYALKSNYPDRIKLGWDTIIKGYINLTIDVTTWGLITTDNIGNQSVNHANSASYADNAGTASRSTNNGSFFISGYEISIG